jgi:hypothetical protein
MSWRRPAISAGFGLAALALLAPAPHVASVTPSTAVGSTLTVTIEGTGFDAKASTVEVVDAAGRRVTAGTLTGRDPARLVATVALAGASPGRYEVRVSNPDGTRSNGATLTLAPQVTISPTRGRPGQPFTYVGRGFTGNSGATTHLQGPDGLEWQAKRYATSPEGTFEREISSGEFVPGTYAVWAMDDRTKITSPKATFEVVAPPAP